MLEIGQTVYLEGLEGKGVASIAAYRPGHYVMLDARNLAWRPEHGVPVTMRAFNNGSYLNFAAKGAGHLTEMGLLTLSAPERTDIHHRRKDRRFFLNLPVPAVVGAGGEQTTLLVKDLSARGLRFVSEDLLEPESPVTLRFAFRPGLGPCTLPGRVVRRDEMIDHYSYGVLFDQGERQGLSVLEAFLGELADFEEYATPEPTSEPQTPAGQSLHMTIGARTFSSRIRGYRLREWLLTDIPCVDGTPVTATNQGEIEAVVRFLREGVASGFTTTLSRQYTSPAPVWVWRYPDRVERAAVRRSLRYRTALPTELEWEKGSGAAMMIDISAGGGRFAITGAAPQKGEAVKLAMSLPDGGVVTGVIADVRCVTVVERVAYVGISFRQEPSRSFDRLNLFLRQVGRQRSLETVF
ncbi:MAG: PilZ domain-containing protein [Nitrospinae bacterium]|nr:PilZ domain-containing protein [Nitrospinota bacterium]